MYIIKLMRHFNTDTSDLQLRKRGFTIRADNLRDFFAALRSKWKKRNTLHTRLREARSVSYFNL